MDLFKCYDSIVNLFYLIVNQKQSVNQEALCRKEI